jgi:hypothetical protein
MTFANSAVRRRLSVVTMVTKPNRTQSNEHIATLRTSPVEDVDGPLLERWFLKTIINLSHGSQWIIGEGSHGVGRASDELVQIAFGKAAFQPKAGLYTAVHDGEKITFRKVCGFRRRRSGDNLLAGMFSLCGFRFFLSLIRDDLEQHQGSHLMYHTVRHGYSTYDDKGRRVRSRRLDIIWP